MRHPFTLALAVLLVGCGGGQTLRIYEENDVGRFGGGTDRYYTQGLRIEYTNSLDSELPVVTPVARFLRLNPKADTYGVNQQYLGISGGQQIFTPEDITLDPDVPADWAVLELDRPYAGWLYGAITHHNMSLAYGATSVEEILSIRDDRLDSIEIQAGVIGPSSLAEDAQTWVHDIIDSDEPQGWDRQLDDEPGFNVIYSRKHRTSYAELGLLGLEHDLLTNFGGSVGNVHTHGQIGGQFRIGHRLRRDFGLAVNAPDLDLRGLMEEENVDERLREELAIQLGQRFSWFVFFGVDGRAVIHNVFLDGNNYSSSHSVRKERFVADFQLGGALQFRSWELSYTQYVRTPEFRRNSDPQIFGSLQLAFRF